MQITVSEDTIYALSSGSGRAGIAVVRVSGPGAHRALEALARVTPPPRRATLARLIDPRSRDTIDRALVFCFAAPASATGEDMAEFHVHGGAAVIARLLESLGALEGLRLAEPGEFTRRAVYHGKLDLTAAEGLGDLIAAETQAQRRQALTQAEGALARLYDGWRERLLSALARAEAELEFPDEDLPREISSAALAAARAVEQQISAHLADGRRGEILRDGLSVAILGAPNAGKSSLLNALAEREAAIVAPGAGTTRDVIEVALDLGGYPIRLADTAGLRATGDAVEAEGVRRAQKRAESADIRVLLFDAEAWPSLDAATLALVDERAILAVSRADLRPEIARATVADRAALVLSTRSGAGIDALVKRLVEAAAGLVRPGETPALTRARHRSALEDCRACLARASSAGMPELAAEDLRLAARALGRITGRVDIEQVLDRVFRDFCIGK
jgi:tRNA modification GTPase